MGRTALRSLSVAEILDGTFATRAVAVPPVLSLEGSSTPRERSFELSEPAGGKIFTVLVPTFVSVVSMLAMPFGHAVCTLLDDDPRVHKEGLDVGIAVQGVGRLHAEVSVGSKSP